MLATPRNRPAVGAWRGLDGGRIVQYSEHAGGGVSGQQNESRCVLNVQFAGFACAAGQVQSSSYALPRRMKHAAIESLPEGASRKQSGVLVAGRLPSFKFRPSSETDGCVIGRDA